MKTWKIVGLCIAAVVVLALAGFALWFTNKAVERVETTSSYQHEAAKRETIALFTAQMVEIDTRLSTETDPAVRRNLEAQHEALRVQVEAAKRK